MPPVAAATAGAVCISSSAVLMKLASTASPSVVALGRCAFALPVLLGLVLGDLHLGPPWPALGWIVLLALSSQVIGWLLITVSMPRLAAGTIGALLLIQPAGSVALSYVILGERPSLLQLAGVALVLTGVVVAVTGRAPEADRAPEAGYSRRRTRIIRHASAASTDTSPSKSP